jgi:hypothetical protein
MGGGKMDQDSIALERESLQYNSQDLDQEQNMDVNPVQNNTVHVTVNHQEKDLSSKITGVTYKGKSKQILGGVGLLLFFGYDSNIPVARTKSDEYGNYAIEALPPGYYSIRTQNEIGEIRTHYIKLLPGQEASEALFV